MFEESQQAELDGRLTDESDNSNLSFVRSYVLSLVV